MIKKYYITKWFYLLPGLLYLAVLASCTGENNSDKFSVPHWRDNVDSLLSALHQKDSFNGTALISVHDTLFKKAFGKARVQPPGELSVEHVFYLGSLAKQFTATAIMVLNREGLLLYDDPVIKYIPELPPVTKNITLRHMLNHTSGLPDYYTMGVFKPGMTNQMVLEAMLTLDSLSFEPGEKYAYSNSGYVLLSVVAERVSGKSLGILLRERVFGPLQMSHTVVFDTTKPTLPPRAMGYTPEGGPDDYGAFTTGGGGIFSNVEDLYKWAKRHDHPDVETFIDKEAYTPARLANDSLSYYGFGWRLDPGNNKIVHHSGSLVGFRTYLYQDLENDIVIILLSNFTNDVTGIQEKIHALLP